MTTILAARDRRLLLDDITSSDRLGARLGGLTATIVVCGAAYGASIGAWHSPRLAMYVAVKLPVMLLVTALLTALFNHVIATLCGLHLRLEQVLTFTLFPLAVAAVVLASATPATTLFALSLPPPSESQRTLHNVLYLIHTALVAAAAMTGIGLLREALTRLAANARRILAFWVVAYAFVGGEVAWALRPFVGSVYLPVEFLRDDALRGNVYEFILTDILPHFWRSLTGAST